MDTYESMTRCICENFAPIVDIGPILFIVAHPDDETISAGGLLQRLKQAHFVHITDGAPRDLSDAERLNFTSREAYAQARKHELQEAIAWAGLESVCQLQCNVIDQETPYNMAGIACRLEKIIEDIEPVCIFTHAYEGGHPDHDTTSFAVWAACRMLKRKKKSLSTVTFEFTSYHANQNAAQMVSYDFIPAKGCDTLVSNLTEKECDTKRKMFSCYKTQLSTIELFAIGIEKFRCAPNYNFCVRPHEHPLYYEYFDWGMTGNYWRRLASEAILLLKIGK